MLRRGGVLTGACAWLVVAAVLGLPAPAASATADVPLAYSTHSGDSCRLGAAHGTLIFHLSPQNRSVDGTAVVSDRAASECGGDDGRLTVLAVTARAGGVAVDEERLTADNGQRRFAFRLTATVRVAEVVVQVCRRGGGKPSYCGVAQSLFAPVE